MVVVQTFSMVTYTGGFWCKYILELRFKFNVIFNIHFDDPRFHANLECSLTRIPEIISLSIAKYFRNIRNHLFLQSPLLIPLHRAKIFERLRNKKYKNISQSQCCFVSKNKNFNVLKLKTFTLIKPYITSIKESFAILSTKFESFQNRSIPSSRDLFEAGS